MTHLSATKKTKYRPSLSNLMNLGETNYMLILRLLADKEKIGEVREFFINHQLSYRLEVKEVTKYTSLISIAQQHNVNVKNMKVLTDALTPVMLVRLYHDARMVEVISSQAIKHIKPRYDYPNQAMHQPDEKQQILLFLKEWLQLCLQQGQVSLDITSLAD